MKKISLAIILIIFTANLYSDSKTILQKTFYESGIIKEEISLINGKKNGVCKYFFDDGSLKSKHLYVDDQLNGKVINYYKNGKIEQESNFVLGVPSGLVLDYYENGLLKNIGYLEDGKFNGAVRGFYKNGSKHYELFYKDGKRLNYINVFNRDQSIIEKDVLKIFTTDNVIYAEYPFENNRIVGTVKYYDENGDLDSNFIYVDPDTENYIYDQIYLDDIEILLFVDKTWKINGNAKINKRYENKKLIQDTNDMNRVEIKKNGKWDFIKFEN